MIEFNEYWDNVSGVMPIKFLVYAEIYLWIVSKPYLGTHFLIPASAGFGIIASKRGFFLVLQRFVLIGSYR